MCSTRAGAWAANGGRYERPHCTTDTACCSLQLTAPHALPHLPAAPARLVLVPRINRVREVLELSEEQQAALWREVDAAARVIQVSVRSVSCRHAGWWSCRPPVPSPCWHFFYGAAIVSPSPLPQDLYRPLKLNIAAIGNIVSQLHVHITGRLQTDPAWPGPCYGELRPGRLQPCHVSWLRLRQWQNCVWDAVASLAQGGAHKSASRPTAATAQRRRRAGRAAGARAASGGAGHAAGGLCSCEAVTCPEGMQFIGGRGICR